MLKSFLLAMAVLGAMIALPSGVCAEVFTVEGCTLPPGTDPDSSPYFEFYGYPDNYNNLIELTRKQENQICEKNGKYMCVGHLELASEEKPCIRLTFEGKKREFVAPGGFRKGEKITEFDLKKILKVEYLH